MSKPCYSPIECEIIMRQIERRKKYREEFLKKRTDPCRHAMESGYVFDDAIQRYMSMKVTQLEHFQPNVRTTFFGITVIIIPMVVYGYYNYLFRDVRENMIREGRLKYRDRIHKFV